MTDERLLEAVAAEGLPGSLIARPTQPLDNETWNSLLRRVDSERLAGLLQATIDSGSWPATNDQRAEAAALHIGTMGRVLLLDRTLLEVAGFFDERDLPFRVLKGSAVAHLDYADPGLRAFGDVDILVRSSDFDKALTILLRKGYKDMFAEPRPGFTGRFGKSATLRSPNGHELDLHRTFVLGPYGLTVDFESLWSEQETFAVGGRPLSAISAEARVLNACYHAVLGGWPPRLLALRDVAELLLFGRYDETRLRDVGRLWGAEAVLAKAVRLTWERFQLADVTSVSAWSHRYQPTSVDSRRLALYERDSSYAAQSLAAVSVLPRMRDKIAFVRSLSIPDRTFLADHPTGSGTGRGVWLARGVRRGLRGAARGRY